MKTLFVFLFLLCFINGSCQTIVDMPSQHYSFKNYVNINAGYKKVTDPSAYLEIGPSFGSNKGVLLPRLTNFERGTINSPKPGLVIYNKETGRLNYYNGTTWIDPGSGGGTDNLNVGSGFTLLRESDQKIKKIYEGLGIKMDSTAVTNSITISTIDTINSVAVKNISDLRSGTYHNINAIFKSKGANDRPHIYLGGYYDWLDGGQGAFAWNPTSTAADNGGTIIQVTGVTTGRWERVKPSTEANVLWFGAKASNSVVDAATNSAAFKAAKESFSYIEFGLNIFRNGGVIKVPRGDYFIDTTFVLDGGYILRGDEGLGTQVSTRIHVTGNHDGIASLASKASPVIYGGPSIIENIAVYSYYQNPNDTTLHGFKIRGNAILRYCLASGFPGNGFDMNTDLSLSDDNYGNAAFSHLDKCRAEFNGNGFYTHGGDANVILVTNSDATANYGWGFWEDGFLGNMYVNCHAADNTYLSGTKSQVKVGSTYYLVRKTNKGIQPGVTTGWEDYYYQLPSTPGFGYFNEWSVDSIYRGGGAYNSLYALNGNNMFLNCYGEGGQIAQFGPRTMVIGGNMAGMFVIENTEMRIEASGGNFVTLTPLRYAHSKKNTIIEMGAQGLTLSPNENYTSSQPSYRWKFDHDSSDKKYRSYLDNFGYTAFNVSTFVTNASDYGLPSELGGMLEVPRGIRLPRMTAGGYRRLRMATAVPGSEEGQNAIGDWLLRSPTALGQSVGWRLIDTTSTDTWEEIYSPYFQGADVASVAGAISIGDGDLFELTGANAVTLISNVGKRNGFEVTLVFTSTASLVDGTANSGTDIGMELAGNTNFTGSAGATLTLVLSEIGGTQRWREKSRSVN